MILRNPKAGISRHWLGLTSTLGQQGAWGRWLQFNDGSSTTVYCGVYSELILTSGGQTQKLHHSPVHPKMEEMCVTRSLNKLWNGENKTYCSYTITSCRLRYWSLTLNYQIWNKYHIPVESLKPIFTVDPTQQTKTDNSIFKSLLSQNNNN